MEQIKFDLDSLNKERDSHGQFISALHECVEENRWKYAGFTSDIYYCLFGKSANALKEAMGASARDSAIGSIPPYMRMLAEKMECDFAKALRSEFEKKSRVLTMDEALDVLIELETNDYWKPLIFRKTYKPEPEEKQPETDLPDAFFIEAEPICEETEEPHDEQQEETANEPENVEIEINLDQFCETIGQYTELIDRCGEALRSHQQIEEHSQEQETPEPAPINHQPEEPVQPSEDYSGGFTDFMMKVGWFTDEMNRNIGPIWFIFPLLLIFVLILKAFY